MATFCLVPQLAEKFKKDILSGKINPDKLAVMTSAERRAFFAQELGEANAEPVNALFESKLLLKHQQQGMITWAKRVMKDNPAIQKDVISRINRMDKVLTPAEENAFLEDLAAEKLGFRITFEEAQKITELSKLVAEKKTKITEDSPVRSKERMEYGTSAVALEDYVNELKTSAGRKTFDDFLRNPSEIVYSLAGSLKSAVASFDNSFFGRQGIKTLYTNPDIWTRAFVKSWGDIGKQIVAKGKWYGQGDDAVMSSIKADIYSRPNALNGKYQAGNYGLNVLSEEAYPSSAPAKIPLLGRLFKASEVAYNGGALRMRADLADRIIPKMEEFGLNPLNKDDAKVVGQLVSSLTGRGSIGAAEPLGRQLNVLLFSIKFLKSNFDTLTAHRLGFAFPKGPARTFARKQAATNLLKIIGTITGILTIAELLHPGSVEKDPRSADFGKIKIGNTRFDPSGGMASLVTLASRLVPTLHDGKWSLWTKSSTTGKYTDLLAGKYGQQNALDVIDSFWQGKLSPFAGIFRDRFKGQMYGGEKPTVKNQLLQSTTPISIQTFQELLKDPNSANDVAAIILDGLGISTNTYSPKK